MEINLNNKDEIQFVVEYLNNGKLQYSRPMSLISAKILEAGIPFRNKRVIPACEVCNAKNN